MNTKIKAYHKLSGVFPRQLIFFFYKGVRITRNDFDAIKSSL